MRPTSIVARVAARHRVPPAAIYGRDRHGKVRQARGAVVVALRRETDMSYPEIGRLLGRDHSTIIAAERRYLASPAVTATCLEDWCDRRPTARGLCPACYRRAHRAGTLPSRQRHRHNVPCQVDGCDRRPKGRGLCGGHYQRLLKHGDVRADVPLGPGPGTVTRTSIVEHAKHGTLSGYQAGCGCTPCRAAKHRHTAKARRGETDRQVPTGRARRHVAALIAAGMTCRQIARLAKVSPPTVDRLKTATRMLSSTEAAVLAVVKPCEDCDMPALGEGRWCGVGRCASRRSRWSWSRMGAA